MTENTLECRNLKKHFPFARGGRLKAVDGISFELEAGKTLGLVGESGCGKSTVGRLLMGLDKSTDGDFWVCGQPVDTGRPDGLQRLRRAVQMVFQDPNASLNPRVPVGVSIAEPMENFLPLGAGERKQRVGELLEKVGLSRDAAVRLPSEFSGGQRQRIGIARALSISPSVVIADEAVSALDVSVQAQIINLLADLQIDLGLSFLFISHDLAVVEHVAHRIAVMYLGRIVEIGTREEVFRSPRHPYTAALLDAAPIEHPSERRKRKGLRGELPSPLDPPAGCTFHSRCPFARDICTSEAPALSKAPSGQSVACHFTHEFSFEDTHHV